MGAKGNKLDGLVETVRTIGTEDNGVVTLFSTSCTVKENNQKIAFDGTTVVTTNSHFSDIFFYCTVFFREATKSSLKTKFI